LIVTFSSSFFSGKDFKIRSYYSKEEVLKRCTTLSMASYFIEDSYSNNYKLNNNDVTEVVEVVEAVEGNYNDVVTDSAGVKFIELEGKKFHPNSYFQTT
jgi:hypothetical protein